MKAASLTLSFLLLAFITNLPLAFSNDNGAVLDTDGNPMFPWLRYYILPAIWGPLGGGLRLGKTGNSTCPVAVLQDYSETFKGVPVGIGTQFPGNINEGSSVDITFTETPDCVGSLRWIVFLDNDIQKACVGIGLPKDHPGQPTLMERFRFYIQKYNIGYKLVYCILDSGTCLNIGRYDNGEGGSRLILTQHEAFDVVFMPASSYNGIRSLV